MTYHDHHFHPLGYAALMTGLELIGAHDITDVLQRVAARADTIAGPIIGQRLNDETLAESRLPTAGDIDDVVSDRPVLLYRYCGHIAIANSAALRLSGVDADTPDPDGGRIDRDATGRPTGILRETAVPLVSSALAPMTPPPSDGEILEALNGLTRLGIGSITGIISVGEPIWCGVPDELATLARLALRLPIDIDVLVIAKTPAHLEMAAERIREADGRLRFHGWKEFADGSLGGHTAALYEPYADQSDTMGTDRLNPAHAIEMARACLDLDGVVAVHAIGDRANDSVLDVYERLLADGADPGRLRVEHASILTERAIERMGRMGVIASIQPAFLASEGIWLEKRLGPHRMDRAYPFRSLLDAAVPLLGGSDSPIELPDPRVGIQAAVDRHGINPGEALTPEQAARLFTPHGLR